MTSKNKTRNNKTPKYDEKELEKLGQQLYDEEVERDLLNDIEKIIEKYSTKSKDSSKTYGKRFSSNIVKKIRPLSTSKIYHRRKFGTPSKYGPRQCDVNEIKNNLESRRGRLSLKHVKKIDYPPSSERSTIYKMGMTGPFKQNGGKIKSKKIRKLKKSKKSKKSRKSRKSKK